MKYTCFTLAFLFSLPAFAAATRCGGDGPNPLSSGSHQGKAELVKTQGLPTWFTVWEDKQETVYQNDVGEVRARAWQSGAERVLTPAPGPLANWRDQAERFLVEPTGGWVFDSVPGSVWKSGGAGFTPLFSSSNAIFGAQRAADGWHLEMMTADHRTGLCQATAIPASWELATGQRYPFFDFYESRPSNEGNLLFTYRINISNCAIATWQYVNPIAGAIQAAYAFDADGSLAVKIDHPKMNLLWTTAETGCRFFDIGPGLPLQPNPAVPVLATQSRGAGISLIDLMEESRSPVLKADATLGELAAGDLYLTGDRGTLYVRTAAEPMLLRVPLR